MPGEKCGILFSSRKIPGGWLAGADEVVISKDVEAVARHANSMNLIMGRLGQEAKP